MNGAAYPLSMKVSNPTMNVNPFTRIRRNHALEHACMQILARRAPGVRMAGYSLPGKFFIIGQVSIEDVRDSVNEALKRLQNGERALAIHPNCGTNFVVSGLAAGTVAWAAMLGGDSSPRGRLERLPIVAALVTLALMLTQPLGPRLQKALTTDANLTGTRVVQIDRYVRGKLVVHRLLTRMQAESSG